MSLKESNYYRMNLSEHIIPSNMLDKWKLHGDGTMLAKSRNVLIGWKDPMIYQLERRAPTPTQEGIMVMRQWLASFRVSGNISDLTNAFGQSRKTNREVKLATELPRGVKHPSVPPGCLLKVETELYGLVSGPSWLRASRSMDLMEAGYVKNHYDRCVYTLVTKRSRQSQRTGTTGRR